MITLYDLKELFVDDSQLIRIYDTETEENMFEGEFCDMPEEYEDCEAMSIDSVWAVDFDGYITINISIEED